MELAILTRGLLTAAICTTPLGLLGDEWFGPFVKVADYRPKGPTHCFRQFNIDWSWIHLRPNEIADFLTQADPAALAEFCRQSNVDGTVVMAVPHHGYCTYATRVGTQFPGMAGDWFGRTIDELHKRRIAAFGYVTLNWNWKFMREHMGSDFLHGSPDAQGVFGSRGLLCLNAPGYLELVEAYTREVLERYPVDGMRWDILVTAKGCCCSGCKQLYRQTYGEELVGWDSGKARRMAEFYMVTTDRVVTRLHRLCKQVKPSVEIWQNCIQSYHPNRLDLGRQMDIAYNEYGDPFRLLFIRGVTGKAAAINGLMNKSPTAPPQPLDHQQWRTCLALGGRCYSYYGHKQTDPRTLLPDATFRDWHRRELAPFYQMVRQIEPWLIDATPVSHVGIVFSERTRYRYPTLDRQPYIAPMEALTNALLQRSQPPEFVNCLDLSDPQKHLERFKVLVLPLTSGLEPQELDGLRRYVEQGGNLVVAGDALRHDTQGRALADFALAREMGVSYQGGATPPRHAAHYGKGTIVYLAAADAVERLRAEIDALAGPPPLALDDPEHLQAVLTQQPAQKRWIVHLLSPGDYSLTLSRLHVPATRTAGQYPKEGWNPRIEAVAQGLRIHVQGPAADRLLVLE